jgi:hypothetical protein
MTVLAASFPFRWFAEQNAERAIVAHNGGLARANRRKREHDHPSWPQLLVPFTCEAPRDADRARPRLRQDAPQ